MKQAMYVGHELDSKKDNLRVSGTLNFLIRTQEADKSTQSHLCPGSIAPPGYLEFSQTPLGSEEGKTCTPGWWRVH